MKLAVLTILLSLGIWGGCTKEAKQEDASAQKPIQATATTAGVPSPAASPVAAVAATPGAPAPSADIDLTTDAAGLSKAAIVMKTTRGTVKFKFYSKDAPNTVKRFAELVQQKFFNGLSFHRVVPGFVVQSGDPKSKNKNDPTIGTGGSGQKLKAEFNGRKHIRGTVAMARSSDPDSADSQFYFGLNAFPHLDNAYTVFGMITDFGEKVGGQDVLDRIHQGDEIVDAHIE